MIHSMIMNKKSYFGYGSREKLIPEIQNNNFKNILLVTDEILVKEQIAKLVTELLDKNNIIYTIYDQVKPNPTISIVKEGLKLAKEKNIDLIVALGGGSSIDTAKAIGLILANPEYEDVISLEGTSTKNKSIPVIAIPTTSGTGSEATNRFLINDEQRMKKIICIDSNSIPIISIIDPDLSKNMPKNIAIESGIEALTRAIEGYMNKNAWHVSDIFNINAMSLIYKNIEKAINIKDSKAIEAMSYAEYLTGVSNTDIGLINLLSNPLGAYFDISNGLANTILLPEVLKYYGQKDPNLFKNIASVFEISKNLTNEEIVELISEKIKNLIKIFNLPKKLKEINIPIEMITTLAKQAYNDVCTTGNFKDVTVDDIKTIYQEVYE